ncbi:hypothetical protein Lal_00026741 [Lupinus albus]|nr:hypothetical protein Lal_00026741 [Lupinus albus]
MTQMMIKVLFICTLLFLSVDAKHRLRRRKYKLPKNGKFHQTPFFKFLPYQDEKIPFNPEADNKIPRKNKDDFGDANIPKNEELAKPDFEIESTGHWDLINQNSGVSAMHVNLLPTNKIIIYDSKIYKPSRLNLAPGMPCVPYKDDQTKENKLDCAAHSMEYDIETNEVKPLTVAAGDPWCSCGGLAPDGTFVSAGGFGDGGKTLRYVGGAQCQGAKDQCAWREYDNLLVDVRWYASQLLLPNGNFILVGGRRSFSYEYIPKEGEASKKSFFFPFLYETSDIDENNLYPFVHLSTDGNVFIFSNNRSLLLNPTTNKVVRTFPVLPGGSRNYPASGMSALLPIDLNAAADANGIKAEVIVCGGNVPDAFQLAETKKTFLPALDDCNRLIITEKKPKWDKELMPSKRTMGDALVLPNGQILFINGAQKGTAAWWDADEPNYTPVIYNSEKPKGQRFKVLMATEIARMYHSTSAVLPNGKIWVGGSNTHNNYRNLDRFPTETRVEAFSPPYLNKDFDKYRPTIDETTLTKELKYGELFELEFSVEDGAELTKNDIKVTMYAPPFTTHGVSMGQKLLVLKNDGIINVSQRTFRIKVVNPPSNLIAPPGYYLLFVVHRGLPGKGAWVHIQ